MIELKMIIEGDKVTVTITSPAKDEKMWVVPGDGLKVIKPK
jgi:hypothetical protein